MKNIFIFIAILLMFFNGNLLATQPSAINITDKSYIDVRSFGAIGNGTSDDTDEIKLAFASAGNGATVFFPSGNYLISSTITIPKNIKILGCSMRGSGTPPSAKGSYIYAKCSTAFITTSGFNDVIIEGISIYGDKSNYPTGHGIDINGSNGITINRLTVSDFGQDGIHCDDNSTGYGIYLRDVYSAQNNRYNYYFNVSDCILDHCKSDAGSCSVYIASQAINTNIYGGCLFEGALSTGIYTDAQQTKINSVKVNMTSGGRGVEFSNLAHRGSCINSYITGASGTYGLVLGGCIEYSISNNMISGFDTALDSVGGGGSIENNQLEGSTTGLAITGNSYPCSVSGNFITGTTNSLLHRAGINILYSSNNFVESNGITYKSPTLTSGSPLFSGDLITGCKIYGSGTQVISSSSYVLASFSAEVFDTGNLFDLATPTRITINSSGKYDISYSIKFQSGSGNIRTGYIKKSGNVAFVIPTLAPVSGGNETVLAGSGILDLSASDYIELFVFQDSGADLNLMHDETSTWLQARYLGR